MNKEKQELLDKCIKLEIIEEPPILGGIYIVPTRKIHESGYKIMYVVGHTPFKTTEETKYYLLDTICDVVDFGSFIYENSINDLHLDIQSSGIIHIWSNHQNMKCGFRLSSCTFEMVDRLGGKYERRNKSIFK